MKLIGPEPKIIGKRLLPSCLTYNSHDINASSQLRVFFPICLTTRWLCGCSTSGWSAQ